MKDKERKKAEAETTTPLYRQIEVKLRKAVPDSSGGLTRRLSCASIGFPLGAILEAEGPEQIVERFAVALEVACDLVRNVGALVFTAEHAAEILASAASHATQGQAQGQDTAQAIEETLDILQSATTLTEDEQQIRVEISQALREEFRRKATDAASTDPRARCVSVRQAKVA
eukprot:COSAG02_NODE_5785_length_4036_cov_3.068834_1_plen_172_part_00